LNRQILGSVGIGFISLLLGVGCNGGGSNVLHPVAPGGPVNVTSAPSASGQSAKVGLSVRIPAQMQMNAARKRQYVASTTASFVFTVTQNGNVVETVPETVGTPACTSHSDGSKTCDYTLSGVPYGTVAIAGQALDASSNLLSEGNATNQSIVAGADNQITITLLGDVAKVVMALASPIPACSPTSAPLSVTAEDADGNVITGTFAHPFVLAASIPTAFPSPAASATPNTSISTGTYPAATGTATPIVTYDGDSPGGATITATVDGTPVGSYYAAPTPKICAEYPVTGQEVQGTVTSGPGPRGIVTAPNGYLFEANYSAGTLGQVTSTLGTGGTPVGTIVPVPLIEAQVAATQSLQIYPRPNEITVGPGDGNLWITDDLNGIDTVAYANVTTQSNYSQDGTSQGASNQAGEEPEAIVAGATGPLFYTNGIANQIAAVTTAGAFTLFPLTTPVAGPTAIPGTVASPNPTYSATPLPANAPNPGPKGMILGSDGNLYFAEMRSSKIGKVSTSAVTAGGTGKTQTEYPVSNASEPYYLTFGPSGNLWFTEFSGSIGTMTTSGTGLVEYPIGKNATPIQIVYGSDGNLYFTDAGNNAIGQITPAGAIAEFKVPTNSSAPFGITLGPDKNAWFTESAGGNVGYLGY
jgi:virginiamycin B lyase